MGPAHSATGNCLSYVKAHAIPHKNRTYTPPQEESQSVVLTKRDFEKENISKLVEKNPNIRHVRIGVHDGEWWLPTSDDLKQLQRLEKLTSLDVSGCVEINRRGLELFSLNPAQIKTMILNDCPKLTDKLFDHIVLFKHLERLDVRGCFRISDNGVEALSALKFLVHLDISVCATEQATRSGASHGGPTITDRSMHTLARMTQLKTLEMEGCVAITDEGWIRLVTLSNLRSLNVSATMLQDRGLKIVRHFPKLRNLDVANCYLSETQAVQQMSLATKMEHLNVSRVPGVTDKFIEGIAQHLNLKHLDISGCEHLSDDCLEYVNRFSFLEHLNANACPGITGRSLASISSLSHLRSLHLNEAFEIDCRDVLSLIALEQLEIGARSTEDERLSMLSELKHLTDLTLHLSDAGSPRWTNIVGIRVHLLSHSNNIIPECSTSSE